jgi:predicted CXXCH cytochrome family protein
MRWMFLAGVLALVLAAAGCSPVQRHTLFTVFFEGVPPLESEQTSGEPSPATAAAQPPRLGAEDEGSSTSKSQAAGTVHPPYKERICEACHNFGDLRRTVITQFDVSSPRSILRQPVPSLCFSCHEDKVPVPEKLAGKWMHGPVAAGACIFCHSPHSTQTPFLLLAGSPAKLCQQCHKPGLMHLGDETLMEKGQDCIKCHSGHSGSRFLLKDFETEEPEQPAPPKGAPGSVGSVVPSLSSVSESQAQLQPQIGGGGSGKAGR